MCIARLFSQGRPLRTQILPGQGRPYQPIILPEFIFVVTT